MSPRAKHIPDNALRTTIALTVEERMAIRWIADVRRQKLDNRTTTNDILVDALWYFLLKEEGKTREQIGAMVPIAPIQPKAKVTQMPKSKGKR